MTIYVDELRAYPQGEYCHMWTDESDETLDAFAKRIGLRSAWVQKSTATFGTFRHYDLTPRKRQAAVRSGAIYKPLKVWIREKRAEK